MTFGQAIERFGFNRAARMLMALPAELGEIGKPCECREIFEAEVLTSAAGFYIGTMCHNPHCEYAHQPNSRESGYYTTYAAAMHALDVGGFSLRGVD